VALAADDDDLEFAEDVEGLGPLAATIVSIGLTPISTMYFSSVKEIPEWSLMITAQKKTLTILLTPEDLR
jgi:hypothetical protein